MLNQLRFCCGAILITLAASTSILAAAGSEPRGDSSKEISSQVLSRVFPSIVRIEAIRLRPNDGRLAKQWSGGSGVIFSADGYVLTNCHVTEDGDFFRCYLYDGTKMRAKLVGQDALTDLAVLKLDLTSRPQKAQPLAVCQFGDSEKLAAGDTVFALGSPGFLSQSVTQGIVANASMVLPEQTAVKMILRGEDVGTLVRWILHDAQIFHGNSGGPLINEKGEIVGINEIGVFSLSGAIPGNLAKAVATQLVSGGIVVRGWSGITVQPRLDASGASAGVIVADVAAGSPAALAGIQPADLVISCDGHAIEGDEERALEHYNRLEMGRLPGDTFAIDYVRGERKASAVLKLARREAAQAANVEMLPWGAIMRDITAKMARDECLPNQLGAWLENIRPAGPCGQAEPELRRGDVIVSVDGNSVESVEALKTATAKLLGETAMRSVVVGLLRDGAVLSSVVELRTSDPRNITPQVRKAWLGVQTQPLTPKLANKLGIKADGGARVTRVYPATEAAAAGLLVGDVILSLDGIPITSRRPEDFELLARQVRQYKVGSQAAVNVWRDGVVRTLEVKMQMQPVPAAELPWWDNRELGFVTREIAFDDRVRLQLLPEIIGVFVESSSPAGWAALAGLRADDIVLSADGCRVTSVDELKQSYGTCVRSGRTWWVLLVQRRNRTQFIEINLKHNS